MGMMTVYHGGYQPVDKPEIRKGRNTKDFGTGFYCTVIKEQAERWARRYDTKVVSIYDVRLNEKLNIKEFKEMTEEWLDFIIDCRSGKSHRHGSGASARGSRAGRSAQRTDGQTLHLEVHPLQRGLRQPNGRRRL